MPAVLYAADLLCSMSDSISPKGGVLVDGERIVAVGAVDDLEKDADRLVEVGGVMLPGLVNAHTHLELTEAAGTEAAGSLAAWREVVSDRTRGWDADTWTRSAHRGVLASSRAGTTALGDVVSRGPGVPAATRAGLAGDSWVEAAQVDVEHQDAVLSGVEHALGLPAQGRRVGVAPHAPSSLGTGVLQALAALAERTGRPLHLHAAESQEEVLALRDGAGPIAERARAQGYEYEWLEGGTGLTPVRYLDGCGALRPGSSIAHGVWVDAAEAELLAERKVTVVCCPRANAVLEVGQAPLERYARAGVALALGTESLASSPSLDVLAEAAAWVRLARARGLSEWPTPDGPRTLEEQAVRLATIDGAAAMGWGAFAGVLAPGRRADFVVVDVEASPDSVYEDLLARGPGRAVLTVLGGVRRSRRRDAEEPWPEIDDTWRT